MKDKTTNPASEKESSPALKGEKSQSAFTLIGVVILIVIIGLMIGTGLEVLGPKVKRSKILNTKKIIDAAIESITGYVATNNRLPDTSTFPAVVSNPNDVWGKPLYYITDEDLTDSTYGGICGRKTTQLQLLSCPSTGCGTPTNTIENVALIILSGSANFNNQTAGSAVVDTETDINHYSQGLELDDYTTDMDRTEPYDDVVKWLTLDELRIKAGCEVSQLKIVNNELPYGYENSAYTATIFGDGGVPYASGGTYKWCRQESASTGLTFILSTLTSDCLNLTESSWTKVDSIVISGTPATAGTYTITFFVRDDNDPSGINDNISQRTLVLTINEPSSSAGTSLWIGHDEGNLQSCDTSGSCTNHGDKGDDIKVMAVFNSKLWIGNKDEHLYSCDSTGSCTDHGDKGEEIKAMAVFDNKLWIGQKEGDLRSCDSSGSCTNHGNKGEEIKAMAVFDNKLWIGQKRR